MHAGVGEDGDALRRRAKVRLRWLVAAHAALAMLPAAIGYFPDPIRHYKGGFLLGRALEGLLLAQLTLLAFWAGFGRGRIAWRLVGVAVGCAYLAIWPTIGSIIPHEHMGGMADGPHYPSEGGSWENFPQTLFHYGGAIGVFVAAFTAAFFMVRRWLNELQWQPEAEHGPRAGVLRYVVSGALALTVCVALSLISRYEWHLNGPFNWDGAAEYSCIAFPVSTICVVWAALGSGRVYRRILFSFVFAALAALSIWIGAYSAWIGDSQSWFDLRTWYALPWPHALSWVAISLLTAAVLAATLLTVRACGYRLARRSAARRQFTLRELLAALTLACVGLAFVVVPAERQRRAVAALEAAGGSLDYAQDFDESDETVWEMFPASCLKYLLPVDYFEVVHYASLEYCQTTDAVLVNLRTLKDLQSLSFAGNPISDAALSHVRGLKRLKVLCLAESPITDAGLANLSELTQLESLDLSDTEITDAAMVHLRELARLENLMLDDAKITDAGLGHLEGLMHLRHLALGRAGVTEEGKSRLRQALPNVGIYGP